jgi:hypothetical protein
VQWSAGFNPGLHVGFFWFGPIVTVKVTVIDREQDCFDFNVAAVMHLVNRL